MELKQLKQFIVLSEALSFRKAAERLHMAQPPLSISIGALEKELGVKLFERFPTGVKITHIGQELLADARRTLHYAEHLRATAKMAAQGQKDVLKVDFVASSTIRLLPKAIARFRATNPQVDLQLNESTANLITTALMECRIDIGLIRYPAAIDASLAMDVVERNTLVAALPPDHPLGKKSSLTLEQLKDEPFVLFENRDGSTSHVSALIACQQAGFTPKVVQQVAHAQTLISLVESGMGVALVPDTYEHLAQRRLSFKRLRGQTNHPIGIALVYREEEKDRPLISSFRHAAMPNSD